eukprot:s533_g5.t1
MSMSKSTPALAVPVSEDGSRPSTANNLQIPTPTESGDGRLHDGNGDEDWKRDDGRRHAILFLVGESYYRFLQPAAGLMTVTTSSLCSNDYALGVVGSWT